MIAHLSSYGGHSFDLADAEAAVEVRKKIRWARSTSGGGDIRARTAGGIVNIFYTPGTPIAISANGPGAEVLDEKSAAAEQGDDEIY
ncbi:MAG TPA: hypothetical protein VFU36_16880 [Jatrophihabitans sp.]|nr:hypothetical protein [Jatrophihabitans sp.]